MPNILPDDYTSALMGDFESPRITYPAEELEYMDDEMNLNFLFDEEYRFLNRGEHEFILNSKPTTRFEECISINTKNTKSSDKLGSIIEDYKFFKSSAKRVPTAVFKLREIDPSSKRRMYNTHKCYVAGSDKLLEESKQRVKDRQSLERRVLKELGILVDSTHRLINHPSQLSRANPFLRFAHKKWSSVFSRKLSKFRLQKSLRLLNKELATSKIKETQYERKTSEMSLVKDFVSQSHSKSGLRMASVTWACLNKLKETLNTN